MPNCRKNQSGRGEQGPLGNADKNKYKSKKYDNWKGE